MCTVLPKLICLGAVFIFLFVQSGALDCYICVSSLDANGDACIDPIDTSVVTTVNCESIIDPNGAPRSIVVPICAKLAFTSANVTITERGCMFKNKVNEDTCSILESELTNHQQIDAFECKTCSNDLCNTF
ncbi:hypothetical protein NQ317_005764 [Molorchus minor]|uniref:Protein sleepless n=1 Tax=Molorchus minor TaxID=1323400 RepID=A0ABQ9JUH6_9CUCU|nr:hypothetical protein NQ317_005764 [Molorchus minor]